MKRKIAMAISLWGIATGAQAQVKQNLEDAIQARLGNGCLGSSSNGLLSPLEAPETSTSVRTENFTYDYNVFQVVNGARVNAPTALVNNWKSDPRVVSLTQDGINPLGYTMVVSLPNSNDEIPPIRDPFATDIRTGFNPQLDGAGEFLTNNVIVAADITQQYRVTTARTPSQGVLGEGLARVCSSTSQTLVSALLAAEFNFSFNASPGPTPPSSGGVSAPTLSGSVSGGGSRGASGFAAARVQEGVQRREKGFWALIERLRRKAGAAPVRESFNRYQIASLDGNVAPPARSYQIVVDAVGSVSSIERNPSSLEAGFSADSAAGVLGAAIVFDGSSQDAPKLIVGGGVSFQKTSGSGSDPSRSSDFEADSTSGTLFAGVTTSPFSIGAEEPARATFTLSGSFGKGDQSYSRFFQTNYVPDLNTNAVVTVSNSLEGNLDQSFTSASLQATVSQSFGALTLQPRASYSFFHYETEATSERVAAGQQDFGMALRYEGVSDEWSEARAGGAVSYAFAASDSAIVSVSLGGEAVFVGDAETPLRTAYFVQDLRSSPAPIIYGTDDLDKQYYDVFAGVSAQFENGLEVFTDVFTRQGQAYVTSEGLSLGVRFTY